MPTKLNDIVDGYKLLQTKDKKIIRMSEKRMRHCLSCTVYNHDAQTCNSRKTAPHITSGKITTGCGCFMPSKTKLESKKCPLGKW